MKKQHNAFKAGLFILIGIVLIVVLLIAIKGVDFLFEPTQIRQVAFTLQDNIGGLRVGDDVRIGGYRVGAVRSIEVTGAEKGSRKPPRIIVSYSIPSRFLIRQDAKLSVETSVTGNSVLNFQSLGSGAPMKANEILAGEPGTLQRVFDALASAAPQLNDILHDVRTQTVPRVNTTIDKYAAVADSFRKTGDHATELIDHLRAKVDPIIAHYHKVADSADMMLGNVGGLFGDVNTDFRGTIANLNKATASLKDQLPDILKQVDQVIDQMNATVGGINDSLGDIRHAITNTKQLTGTARDLLTANRTRISDMIASLKQTGDNLKSASAEIRRSPWRLLYKPKKGEMANMNVFDAARAFAEGANDMSDAAGALRDVLSLPHPDQKQVEKLMKQLNMSFDHFQQVEKKLWKSVGD